MPAPAGDIALPRAFLAATLAASSTFQTWVGTPGDAAAALAKIHFGEVDVGTPAPVPPLVIISSGSYQRVKIAVGSSNTYSGRGSLMVFFRDAVLAGESTAQSDVEAAFNTFENVIGAVWNETEAFSGAAGYLDIASKYPDGPAGRVEFQEAESQPAGSFWEWPWTVTFENAL